MIVNKEILLNQLKKYTNKEIDRDALEDWAKNITWDMYSRVIIEEIFISDITRLLNVIREMSYSDEQIVELIEILEGKKCHCSSCFIKIPQKTLSMEDRKLIDITNSFIFNFENNIIFESPGTPCPRFPNPISIKRYLNENDYEYITKSFNEYRKTTNNISSVKTLNEILVYNIIILLQPISFISVYPPSIDGISHLNPDEKLNVNNICGRIKKLIAILSGDEYAYVSVFYDSGNYTVSII